MNRHSSIPYLIASSFVAGIGTVFMVGLALDAAGAIDQAPMQAGTRIPLISESQIWEHALPASPVETGRLLSDSFHPLSTGAAVVMPNVPASRGVQGGPTARSSVLNPQEKAGAQNFARLLQARPVTIQ